MDEPHNGVVRLERHGQVGLVTIDRPAKLNAMTIAMDRQMNEIAYLINNDRSIRSVVLSGEGDRAFCAGSDLTELEGYGDNWSYRNRFDARSDYARAVWLIRKPLVAAIQGYCIGGGLEMAAASDIRLATPTASFGAGEINWGWHGGSGQTQLLTRLVGSGWASRMLLTGERIDGREAHRIGLVQHLVPATKLLAEALTLASTIAERPPIAVERAKYMVRVAQNVPLDAGLLVENDSFAYLMTTADAAEGKAAFSEKRVPHFEGR